MIFEDIKRVYARLGDEQSRRIFGDRLLYSITSDEKHIRELVNREIEYYTQDDQMYRLIQWIDQQAGKIIVFGAGFAGFQIIKALEERSIKVEYICDNKESLWGTIRYGIEVIPPDDLLKFPDASIIIGINKRIDEVLEQLNRLGITARVFAPSKEWWIGKYDQYFDSDIVKVSSKEVLIDGGAFDGGDTIRFMNWCGSNYCESYLMEPDHSNCIKTKELLAKYENIEVMEYGLWKNTGVLRFASGDQENSSVSDSGDIEINTISIDEIRTKSPITFIKMDIEGSEGMALDGAINTIKKNKPKLAICVYHKPEDILEIPLKILDMVPEYKLYLRHYSYVDTETVLYAVCD